MWISPSCVKNFISTRPKQESWKKVEINSIVSLQSETFFSGFGNGNGIHRFRTYGSIQVTNTSLTSLTKFIDFSYNDAIKKLYIWNHEEIRVFFLRKPDFVCAALSGAEYCWHQAIQADRPRVINIQMSPVHGRRRLVVNTHLT